MKIDAVIAQFPVSFSIKENLHAIEAVLEKTHPGDLVIFPEGSLSGYSLNLSFLGEIDIAALHEGLARLKEAAQFRKIHLWAGACMRQDGGWFNNAYGFTPHGEMHIYHKINLANHERGVFQVGHQLPVFHLQMPDGVLPVGVQLCRELRYPEQWGWLARQGAKVILHMNNAIGDDRLQPVWRSHLVSRAAETQRYVLSANNAAAQQISPTVAITPGGQIIAEIVSDRPEAIRVELDLSTVSNWYLDQCRDDLVKICKTEAYPHNERDT